MPTDPDEDLTPVRPAPTARPALASHSPTHPPPARRLTWGVCGATNEACELTSTPGGRGVGRSVIGGVGFRSPPLPGLGWRPAPGISGRYELEWPGDPSVPRTLTDLRADLDHEARAGRSDASGNPLLRELDGAATNLLDTADRLHQDGWSLGLLRPENVLLIPGGGVFLADLGFTWSGSFGEPPWDDSPGRPDWLEDGGGPAAWLHPESPSVRRQFAGPDGPYPPAVPAEDVRLLARLFAWLIGGPPSARVAKLAGGAEVWEVLANAAGGQVSTTAGLAASLRAHPLSDHFTAQPLVVLDEPAPTERSWRPVIGIVLLSGLAAVGTSYWLREQTAPTSTPPPSSGTSLADPDQAAKPDPDTPSASFPELLAAFDRVEGSGDLAGMASALPPLLAASGVTPAQVGERDRRRTSFLTAWEKGYREALAAAAVPARRHDAAASFRDLYVQLRSVVDSHPAADPPIREREAQCLTFAKQYAEQLGALP